MRRKILFSIITALAVFTACAEEEQTQSLMPPTLLSPADGATITQNPPTFVWSTVNEDSILYLLEVSTDLIFMFPFTCISTTIVPTDTQYLADSAFAPGTYYWRMCTQEDC